MPNNIKMILEKYIDELIKIYNTDLKTVILYGSYARGDNRSDSDIDIMILVNLSDEDIRKKSHTLSDLTYDYNYDNNLEIMPIVKNIDHFNKWLRSYPFYNIIKNEGVELYAA